MANSFRGPFKVIWMLLIENPNGFLVLFRILKLEVGVVYNFRFGSRPQCPFLGKGKGNEKMKKSPLLSTSRSSYGFD